MTAELRIPALGPDMTVAECALLYASNGWFVLPIGHRVKHAGSVLGRGWPAKTSRDPEIIRHWFRSDDYGVALHVGRSGALVFDVDRPDCVPLALQRHLDDHEGPFQTTRLSNLAGRGHYCFLQPVGQPLGNGRGSLQGDWGDVRGKNGIIVVEPTVHAKQAEGGGYRWQRHGLLPPCLWTFSWHCCHGGARSLGAHRLVLGSVPQDPQLRWAGGGDL